LALLSAVALQACSPMGMAIGAGAAVVNSASEERGLDGTATDGIIDATARDRLTDLGHGLLSGVGVTVRERRLLLTGQVPTEADHQAVLEAVRTIPDVAEVLDALLIRPDTGIADAARDQLVAEDLARDLLFDSVIKSVNYAVVSSDRVIYLMGVAQDSDELERTLRYARNTAYVRGVVSLVRLRDDPRRLSPRAQISRVEIHRVAYRPDLAIGGIYRPETPPNSGQTATTGFPQPGAGSQRTP
jgi:osmotically-inducible protein OsmY